MERRSVPPTQPDVVRVLAVCDKQPSPAVELLQRARRTVFEVEHVQTKAEALPRLAAGRFDACVLSAAVENATALLYELRELRSPVRVVLIAQERSEAAEAEALRLGATDYLVMDDLTPALIERSVALAAEVARRRGTMQRSEADFRAVLELSPEAIMMHQRGVLLYVNPALVKLLGYESKVELIARPVHEVVHGEDLRAVWAEMRAYVEQGRAAPLREVRLVRRDGSIATTEVVGMPIVLDADRAVLSIARDVTERKELQARILFADRMASMGTLAAGVAHEINNPLAYITANLEYIAEELTTTLALVDGLDEMRRAVVEAREGAERVRLIVRDLKTFSRADEDRRVSVDLRRVLESAVNMAHNEIRHRARLVKDLGPVPPVMANEARLGQVFLNLLVNAAHAIPEGNASQNQIRVACRAEGERAVVEISDTGVGIPPEILDRIFIPFFTTKPVGLGTGLGLAICQSIVSALGGSISVASKVGEGTKVRVELPISHEEVIEHPSSTPTCDARRGRVLILDDEPQIGMALRRSLRNEHDVVSVTDAREALARLERGERFDVILCDLMMPEMTGMDFFAEVQRKIPQIAPSIVFFTGGAFTERAQTFLDTVTNPTLEKPPNLRKLRELLRERVG
jgi:PAS domain S-box-containing protein